MSFFFCFIWVQIKNFIIGIRLWVNHVMTVTIGVVSIELHTLHSIASLQPTGNCKGEQMLKEWKQWKKKHVLKKNSFIIAISYKLLQSVK